MLLNDTKIKNLRHKEKQYKITDGKGMYLLVHPNGSKYWRLKYRFLGKERVLALGVYPGTSLKEARNKKNEAKKLIEQNIDPAQRKKQEKASHLINAENSFEKIAYEWLEIRKQSITEKYAAMIERRIKQDAFPIIGSYPITDITSSDLLRMLRGIENRGAIETAQRMKQYCGQIFRFAIATGRAEHDIAANLRGALKTRKAKHHPYLEEKDLPDFFHRLEHYDGDLQTKLGLKLLVLTFVRTGELRGAKWEEINEKKKEWHIPAERMKMKQKHIVPLSKQSLKVIEELRIINGNFDFIFPNANNHKAFISENTLLYAMYRMGYHSRATPHGMRSTASTTLNEHGFRPDYIERQLAHAERNKIRASYNHAEYLPERREMMQWWADFLDKMAAENK